MSKTMIMDHPLVQHKVSLLRNKNTGTKEFKELVCELATLLCYEATRDLPTEEVEIETPIAVAKTRMLSGRKLALVPILRAGLGMVDGMLALIPAAKVGHIGMYRNEETLEPVEYYCSGPDARHRRQRRRRHHANQKARCKEHQVHWHHRCARRHAAPAGGASRRGHLCGRDG